MSWAAAIPPALQFAGAVGGGLFEGDPNIDRSPGLQQTGKNLLHQGSALAQAQMGQTPNISANLGPSPLTSRGAGMIAGAVPGMQPLIDASQGAFTDALNIGNLSENPLIADALNAMREQSAEYVGDAASALGRGFVGGGMYGGGRSPTAMGVLASREGADLGRRQAGFLGAMVPQAWNRQSKAMGMAPRLATMGAMPGAMMMDAGAQEQAARMAQMQGQLQREQGLMDLSWSPVRNWTGAHSAMWGSGPPPVYPSGPSNMAVGAGLGSLAGGIFDRLWSSKKSTPATQWT